MNNQKSNTAMVLYKHECVEALQKKVFQKFQDEQKNHPKLGNEHPLSALMIKSIEGQKKSLRNIFKTDDSLLKLETATAMALRGMDDGLNTLLAVDTLTNSQIEFFYAKAGLIFLNQPIPLQLKEKKSVFNELEKLIDDCLDDRR